MRGGRILVPVALLAFAGFISSQPFPFSAPVGDATSVPAWATNPTPIRQPAARPEFSQAGYTYRCIDCHKIIPSPLETLRTLTQHSEIDLQHGINTRCFNCHHRTNRDAFVDDYGGEIPWTRPHRVCAKCHGPVYRDWQHGSHGRTNGYWDRSRGDQIRLQCTQCHDPHHPQFPALQPAPPPHTLRMGVQEFEPHRAAHDPLQVGSRRQISGERAEP